MRFIGGVIAAALLAVPAPALAWGATGHRMVGELAMEALPADLPAFLRAPGVATTMGELAREPDRWKGSGKLHDSDRDAAHFIDVDDDGKVMGGPALDALPNTRAAYEEALRAVGSDSWQAGYLYHALADGWLQLVQDFALWRAVSAGERLTDDPERRAWYAADRARREALLLRDLGVYAHYIADGAQPLHVSIHFNGWTGANPQGFTSEKVHSRLEGAFVKAHVGADAVRSLMSEPLDCRCSMETRTVRFLQATAAQVQPFYALEKAGGFAPGDPRGTAFMAQRLAAGASELRDMTADAWEASARASVGWPQTPVADIETGRVDAFLALYGND